uniref:Secreted protein n=1 Tax=Caenorhabditis tropicalis TaxID=1561998 RepID=A0A1I7U558_9PELO
MFSLLKTTVFLVFLISTVTSGIIRDRRAIEDYWYSNGVVNNVVSDNMVGGPTSLGWAQVPHVYSPMFSPVFGK